MRTILAMLTVVVASLLPVGSAGAATPTETVTVQGASWIISQVRADGSIEDPYSPGNPSYTLTSQGVLALAAAGQGKSTIDSMQSFLAANVETYVHSGGNDQPGSLAYLILGAVATGKNPTSFGGVDLVARLQATQRPDGLYGLAALDPTYDGVFRQSLSLLALDAAGITDPDGLAWLQAQQCDDGSFVAYRADTSAPCPDLDLASFTGPDTNSTALAAMALHTHGVDVAASMAWLDSVRTSDGGFTYFGDPTGMSDGNSTGLVLTAFVSVEGAIDPQAAAVLGALQVSCDSPIVADRGGIAFQPQDGDLFPNLMATTQALWGLGGQAFPLQDVAISDGPIEICTTPVVPTTTMDPTTSTTVAVSVPGAASPTTTPLVAATTELPRTGGSVLGLSSEAAAVLGAMLVLAGSAAVTAARRRTQSDV